MVSPPVTRSLLHGADIVSACMQENADFHSTLCDHLRKLLEDDSNLPAQQKLLEALSSKCTDDRLDRQKEAAVDQQLQHANLMHGPDFGLHGFKQASPLPGDLAIMNIHGSSAVGGSILVPVPSLSGSPTSFAQPQQQLQLARAPAEVAAFQLQSDKTILQAASKTLLPPQLQSISEQDGMELIGEQGPLETAPDQTSLQMASGLGRSASHQEPPAEAPPAEISNCRAAVSCADTHTNSGALLTAPPLTLPAAGPTAGSSSQLPATVPAAAAVAREAAPEVWQHAGPEAAGAVPAYHPATTCCATSSAALNQLPTSMPSVSTGPPVYAKASELTAALSAAETQLTSACNPVLQPLSNSSPDSKAASGAASAAVAAAAREATPAASQSAVQTMPSTSAPPPASAKSIHMEAMPDSTPHATASAASQAAAASINPAPTAAADSWQLPDLHHPWPEALPPIINSSEGSLWPKHVYAERHHPVAGALSKPLFPRPLHDGNTPWPAASVLAAQHHGSSAGQDPAALRTGDPSSTAQDPSKCGSAPTASASPDVQHRQQASSAAPLRSPTVFSRDQGSTAQAPADQPSHAACAAPRVTPAARRSSDREASIAQVLASLEGLPQHPLGSTVLSPGGVTPLWKPEVRLQHSTEGELYAATMQ